MKRYIKLNEDINDPATSTEEEAGISAVITNLINQEYQMLSQYDSAQVTLEAHGDDTLTQIFDYITDDIYIHIGMLQTCLGEATDSADKIQDGIQQADQLLR